MYTVTLADSAKGELAALDSVAANRIISKLRNLASDPRPRGVKKLVGEDNIWRIRIGDYRVIYSIFDKQQEVVVTVIRHRSKAYR